MTSRGCTEDEFEVIADFLLKAVQISQKIQKEHGNSLKAFLRGLQNNDEADELRANVEKFALSFEMPGMESCT
jgi:glycine hydroxymethyltransferase